MKETPIPADDEVVEVLGSDIEGRPTVHRLRRKQGPKNEKGEVQPGWYISAKGSLVRDF